MPVRNAVAKFLNRDCYCKTLNSDQLKNMLATDLIATDILASRPELFSETAVFISKWQLQQMRTLVRAVERVILSPNYQAVVLQRNPTTSATPNQTAGVFMGYDFHLSEAGPKIIEINTNAGGGFLNAALVAAQTACCEAAGYLTPLLHQQLNAEFVAMFKQEWQRERGDTPLQCIAIIDENPNQQFLYPEFLIAQRLFNQAGILTVIADPAELQFKEKQLTFQEQKIDLVYNRLTDFSLTETRHTALRLAYENKAVVLTPSPWHHAQYADKRNLSILSNAQQLAQLGVNSTDIEILSAGIPRTLEVNAANADLLWQTRKQLFFKPTSGFGSRAAYRGDKLTKRVWQEILQGNYVAQQQIPPSERGMLVDEQFVALKLDIRAYVYAGEIQLLAARLYQGQTTNFRTQGGGFAPVFVVN